MTSLKEIVTHGKSVRPPKFILYGIEGIGKSTFGASLPNPIFLQTEDGLGSIDCAKLPLCHGYYEVIERLDMLLNEEHNYKTLVIDTIDWLEKLLFQEVCRDFSANDIGAIAFGRGQTAAMAYWKIILDKLDAIRNSGIIICLLGHSTITRFETPLADGYDKYSLDLYKKSSAMIRQWAEAVLFVNYKVYTRKVDTGFGQTTIKAIGSGERAIYTCERPAYDAKNHWGLPEEMPFEWKPLADAIKKCLGPKKKTSEIKIELAEPIIETPVINEIAIIE